MISIVDLLNDCPKDAIKVGVGSTCRKLIFINLDLIRKLRVLGERKGINSLEWIEYDIDQERNDYPMVTILLISMLVKRLLELKMFKKTVFCNKCFDPSGHDWEIRAARFLRWWCNHSTQGNGLSTVHQCNG